MNETLLRAINHLTPPTQAALARVCGQKPQAVTRWLKTKAPAKHCVAIEEATGGVVTRYDLRPDVFGSAPVGGQSRAA
ncbi:YdaS family helix-turn-helix protein [Pseudoxanthomonas indica]|uniref:YdaS family helix-turn-helix protein n=1 Tax=Pseudoxanthomonas indica TaxID=428993 RepID=UPI001591FAEF|nr:YdaS family helix-turn-helix protein [Pseudoxanthomonas indica]GGD58015.1 hypothetical protein GCM10007235_32860 [Pseudoxanthomonas indica]